jgi:hypothetical protein
MSTVSVNNLELAGGDVARASGERREGHGLRAALRGNRAVGGGAGRAACVSGSLVVSGGRAGGVQEGPSLVPGDTVAGGPWQPPSQAPRSAPVARFRVAAVSMEAEEVDESGALGAVTGEFLRPPPMESGGRYPSLSLPSVSIDVDLLPLPPPPLAVYPSRSAS